MNSADNIFKVGERIDSFSLNEFKARVEKALTDGCTVLTLDLAGTKFLSIPCIKLIAFWANELQSKNGKLILLGPTEKLKRQIGIFGSLDALVVKKTTTAPEEKPTFGLPVLDETPGF